MAWTIKFSEGAKKDLSKLDKPIARRIRNYLRDRVAPLEDPRSIGDALNGSLDEFWKYRVGDYRILCKIEDEAVIVFVVRIGNRREVYR